MREIKFRGVTPAGETVYGDLNHLGDNLYINDFAVIPESVVQLCGYDLTGDEVYEGDKVIAHGKEYEVKIVTNYGVFKNLKVAIKKI